MQPQKPPAAVRAAVLLLALDLTIGFCTWILSSLWLHLLEFWILLPFVAFACFYIRAIGQGRNWARWVLAITAILASLGSLRALYTADNEWIIARHSVQILTHLGAAALTFLPASTAWFKRPKDADHSASPNHTTHAAKGKNHGTGHGT